MIKPNFKKLGRRFKNTGRRIGTIIRKGASMVRTLLGTVDNMSGGAMSAKMQSDPRSALLLGQVNRLADIDASRQQRNLL
jgi:hypothetical protein